MSAAPRQCTSSVHRSSLLKIENTAPSPGGRSQASWSAVEAGVRRAEDPDLAVAPLLRGEPGDHLDQVGLLLGRVLVGRVARRRPRPAQVEPADGEAVLVAEVLVAGGVRRGEVVLAIGQRLQQARLRAGRRVGQVQRRGQLDAVSHRDPDLGHDSSSRTSGECRDSLVLPSRPTVVGAVNIEFRTASSAASTTAANSGSSARPPSGARSGCLVAVQPHPGAERHEDLAAAVVRHRTGAGQAEPDPPGQPGARGAVDRCVGDDQPDARSGGLLRRRRSRRQQPPDGHAGDDQLLADAEVRHQQHGDRVALGGHPRRRYRCRP